MGAFAIFLTGFIFGIMAISAFAIWYDGHGKGGGAA